jgi:hypothetical protein
MSTVRVVAAGNGEPQPQGDADAPAGSVLAGLRARAAVERTERTLEVPIGGETWGDALLVRYGMPSMVDADRLMAAAARFVGAPGAKGAVQGPSAFAVDVMATCCRTVLGSDGQDTEDLGVGLDGGLWELLMLPLPPGVAEYSELTPREVIGGLFEGNWLAVGNHSAQVMTWLRGGVEPPGEAQAPTES